MEQFKQKSKKIREKLQGLCEKRDQKILEIVEIEKEIEIYLEQEKVLKDEIVEYKIEIMSLDTEYEDERGVEELRKEIDLIKEEKNFLIQERKLVSRGIANHLRNIWNRRMEDFEKEIEELQKKEDRLFEKLVRISRKMIMMK